MVKGFLVNVCWWDFPITIPGGPPIYTLSLLAFLQDKFWSFCNQQWLKSEIAVSDLPTLAIEAAEEYLAKNVKSEA